MFFKNRKETKMPEREYIWFIEPLNSDTNEVIALQLEKENFNSEIVCADKRRHNLWTCSNQFAMSLTESKESFNLHFKIWGKQGRPGKIRDKTFLFSKKWKKTQRAKKQKAKTAN